MAQHIETKEFKQKAFRKIEQGIEYAFKKSQGLMKTSFVYQFIGLCDKGHECYTTDRKIPTSIMGTECDTGCFEIHYNKESRKIISIYLVA